jgi:hypothetical protein
MDNIIFNTELIKGAKGDTGDTKTKEKYYGKNYKHDRSISYI